MIYLKSDMGCKPVYQTKHSAGADLVARTSVVIPAGKVVPVPTGVYIDMVDRSGLPEHANLELQIRARSGMALRSGLTIANGIGTIDADYPDEIVVLFHNFSNKDYLVMAGERIAQLVMGLTWQVGGTKVNKRKRTGGLGSTGTK